jgi:hypothetical protein
MSAWTPVRLFEIRATCIGIQGLSEEQGNKFIFAFVLFIQKQHI